MDTTKGVQVFKRFELNFIDFGYFLQDVLVKEQKVIVIYLVLLTKMETKIQLHLPRLRKYMLKNQVDKNHPTVLDNYTSFMFVRDPFSRLLSGYLDKMLLPNEVGHNFFRWQLAHM